MSDAQLRELYRSAALIINLHGGTVPLPEHSATGRLVYLETDPVAAPGRAVRQRRSETIDFLEPHCAFFTFGENYGQPGLRPAGLRPLPRSARRASRSCSTSGTGAGGGRQRRLHDGRQLAASRGATSSSTASVYHWSKHHEFLKFLDLPARTGPAFELALSQLSTTTTDAARERDGWRVRRRARLLGRPRRRTAATSRGSRGEFTVAKDQNVRLRSGWFSDRSATVPRGRPAGRHAGHRLRQLPADRRGAVRVLDARRGRRRRSRRSRPTTRGHRRAAARRRPRVLRRAPRAGAAAGAERCLLAGQARTAPVGSLPPTLDLVPLSRGPRRFGPRRWRRSSAAAIPETGGDRLGARRHDVSVIVVAPDGIVFTRLCAESILLGAGGAQLELVVVDNGSSDGTREYLVDLAERDSRVQVVRNDVNRGFAPGVNQGLARATGDSLVILNNDTLLPPGWLGPLLAHLERPEVGLVGPVTNRCGNEAEIDAAYRTLGEMIEFAERRSRDRTGESFDIEVATLFCAATRRDVFEVVGALDERFEVGLFEDDDYAQRVRAAGYRVVCAEDAFVHHFGEASLGGLVPTGRYGDLFRQNQQRFEEKWGVAWQSHLRRPNAWYSDLIDRIRAVVDHELPPDATGPRRLQRGRRAARARIEPPLLALPANR